MSEYLKLLDEQEGGLIKDMQYIFQIEGMTYYAFFDKIRVIGDVKFVEISTPDKKQPIYLNPSCIIQIIPLMKKRE